MKKIVSEGQCLFCNKTFKKAGINRHLQKHLEDKTQQGRPGKSFLLKIEPDPSWGSSPYFLSLWMDGEAKMEQLDDFLRAIWLECCGHMSAFTNPKKTRQGEIWDVFEAEGRRGEVSMDRKSKEVFEKGLKLEYEYDFGSTTKLLLTVVDEYNIKADKKIVLLSRNEPLKLLCSTCGLEPATQICTVCDYEEEAIFCEKCAKDHADECADFEDYAAMPIVNSPRMGMCGYVGGTIDKERDGVITYNE
ncbi:MAG: hypothetical protein WBA61_11425 [Aequorivita sp.]